LLWSDGWWDCAQCGIFSVGELRAWEAYQSERQTG
jgi:hypothetical protein